MSKKLLSLAALGALCTAFPALADGAPTLVETKVISAGDTAWMMTSTALVLFMTIPGLALFYAGMVRKKNVLATLMQSFAICALITVLWTVVGYSLEAVFMIFQMTFAIITPALITGAFAERMKFSTMLVFMALWSLLVYVPVAHWVWAPGGWMFDHGVLDFAGGTVVHINAGIAGLVAALVLGKRVGFGREAMPPHNLVLTLVGASMLWVGWFGFNAGSAVAADGRAAMAMVVTQVATGMAALSWMAAEWIAKGKPSVLGIVSGAVAGLVAITPAAGFVDAKGALAIGLISGAVCYWSATSLKHMLKYDDSLDAFGVHGVGGIIGALLTGIFAVKEIGGVEGNLMTQAVGVGATVVYCAIVTFILLKLLDMVMGLRVSEEEEREGLDVVLHGERVE